MNICTTCKKEFETYDDDCECEKCNEYGEVKDGIDEDGEDNFIPCPDCNGEQLVSFKQTVFCCSDCSEEFYYPQHPFL